MQKNGYSVFEPASISNQHCSDVQPVVRALGPSTRTRIQPKESFRGPLNQMAELVL
jgi:hypothetical protein